MYLASHTSATASRVSFQCTENRGDASPNDTNFVQRERPVQNSNIISQKSSNIGAYEHMTMGVANPLTTLAGTKPPVIVDTCGEGLMNIGRIKTDKPKNRVLPERVTYEVSGNVPF